MQGLATLFYGEMPKTAKKATPQDESALQKIESILDLNDTSRQTMLDEITAAKNSIEGFVSQP